MEYPLAEVLDRLTIETRKWMYGADNHRLLCDLSQELPKVLRVLQGLPPEQGGHGLMYLVKLAIANADIANLEWQVREGNQLTLEETGLRAKKIREINDRRVSAKNALARLFGQHSESRVFGYGEGLPAEKLTLEVQGGGGV